MISGIIILSIIAFLFLSMYLYAYGTTKYNAIKEEREEQNRLREIQENEQQLERERLKRLNEREENSRLAATRSKIIKRVIERLQQSKQKQKA